MSKIKNKILPSLFLLFIFAFALALAFGPKKARSENEKRVLSTFPKVSVESVFSGDFTKEFEAFLSDHFPLREKLVGLDAYAGLILGQNGENGIYYGKNGYLITEPPTPNKTRIKKNADYVSRFIDEASLPSSVIIVPTTGYTMSENLPKNHKEYCDNVVLDLAKQKITNAKFIDLRNTFNENKNSTQIYYKTDHHLTSEGSILIYNDYCKAFGLEPKSFKKSETVNGFFGTCYSKSGFWNTKSDSISLYKTDTKFTVTINDGKKTKTNNSLYFNEHLENADKYPVFLDGNHALTKIHNESLKNGKCLLIVKDSYSHCFTTFLAENYENIILVDLRYYKSSVKTILNDEGVTELLFMFGSENFNSSTDLAWLLM